MPPAPYDVVLFDLGGVLIDFGGVAAMKELAGIDTDDELWRRWLACEWVRTFERGHCSADEFARGVVADWALALEPEEFLAAFRSWPRGPLPGAAELVGEVRATIRAGCLSNTNSLHWEDHYGRWTVLEQLDERFLSFEIGHVKPDRSIFDRVAELLGTRPERVLFVDDNRINVDAALDAGFRAVRAVGPDQARRALVEAGVLHNARN